MQIIDPHLHLFNLQQGKYSWLRPENPPFWPDKQQINRDFSEQDLQLTSDLSLAGYVHIEAGFDNNASWTETDWVSAQANIAHRSVAHLDLRLDPDAFTAGLNELRKRPAVTGIRHIWDEELEQILSHGNTQENFTRLQQNELHFELQFDARLQKNVALVIELLSRFPRLHFVLNHAGYVASGDNSLAQGVTLSNLAKLAARPNISVKSSGYEMQDRDFSLINAAAVTEKLTELFGLERVMLASNFPLITLSLGYAKYWQGLIEALATRNLAAEPLVYANAKRIYRFN